MVKLLHNGYGRTARVDCRDREISGTADQRLQEARADCGHELIVAMSMVPSRTVRDQRPEFVDRAEPSMSERAGTGEPVLIPRHSGRCPANCLQDGYSHYVPGSDVTDGVASIASANPELLP
jgi:hypothetical protein